MRVSAFSFVKQRGGFIFMTLWSSPSSLIMILCFSSILCVCVYGGRGGNYMLDRITRKTAIAIHILKCIHMATYEGYLLN